MEEHMKRIRVLTAALIALAVAGTTAAQAQDARGRKSDDHGRQPHQAQPAQQAQRDPYVKQDVSQQEQQRRIQEEQQRNAQYRQRAEQQTQALRDQNARLRQANRAAQYRAQQAYAERIREQQLQQQRLQPNYNNDPYIRTPNNYRYNMGGVYRQTNQYGADMLRQAVNNGYLEGIRAGQADRQDGWAANIQNSPAYRDANYGYTGNYVAQSDYNYYFRQGFQRGYEDGYNSRSQYGNYSNGNGSILANILSGILGLQSIR
jgi:hypothetical protein